MKINKTKTITVIVMTFGVFFVTFFALAENKNANSIFLDSDQDGLTDQEEAAIGTDPRNADTDSDGYQDGKELKSGYNPLKKAPGDALMPASPAGGPASSSSEPSTAQNIPALSNSGSKESITEVNSQNETAQTNNDEGNMENVSPSSALLSQAGLNQDILTDLSSDPEKPNLTNEMIGQFLQLTKEKSENSEDFSANPELTPEDFDTITQNALETVDIAKELPEIRADEMKVLPPIDDKDLDEEEKKEKQKVEIEKYFASLAFVFASKSPFPIDEPNNLTSSVSKEQENLLAAMMSGNQEKMDDYAQRARDGIEQIKKVEVPHILQEIHKSALQLSIYTLGLKDKVVIDQSDPMKNLAALSSLQAVAQSSLKLQSQMKAIADEYGISSIELP